MSAPLTWSSRSAHPTAARLSFRPSKLHLVVESTLEKKNTLWIVLGVVQTAVFASTLPFPPAQGLAIQQFLVIYSTTFVIYLFAVKLLRKQAPPGFVLWGGALLFRLLLLTTSPRLSDDLYRYIWDGHLSNLGINPFAERVDAAVLDAFEIPERKLINNAWMASPYLPGAQLLFAAVTRIAPRSPLALQTVMVLLDLLAGFILVGILRSVNAHPKWVLLYLWNPLVIFEFAHGAHVDALMIVLTLGSIWLVMRRQLSRTGALKPSLRQMLSGLLLAVATLTKGLPALLLALIWPIWRKTAWLAYIIAGWALALPYLLTAGFGLIGERDGTGLFGALRIYGYQWNFNGGLYHWLEILLSGQTTEGALPPGTWGVAQAKIISLLVFLISLTLIAIAAKRVMQNKDSGDEAIGLNWLRWAWLPFAAYFLLTSTVNPWYLTLLVPGVVFWIAADAGKASAWGWFGYAMLIWSWSVSLSYLTYVDAPNLRETDLVRLAEYLPVYGLLLISLAVSIWPQRLRTFARLAE